MFRLISRVGAVAAISIGITTLSAQTQTTRSAAALMQAGEARATIQGDIAGAVSLYEEAAAAAGADRALAARALLAAGVGRATLGEAGARAVLERVATEFADQTETAAKARERLTGLLATTATSGSSRTATRREGGELVQTARGAIGSLSADGRYIAFSDWSSGFGNLAIRDLRTGETRRLTEGASARGWVGDGPIVSPDGSQIAYRWEGGADESTRLIRSDGTGMRVLTRHPYGENLEAWSPDGRWIATIRRNYNDSTAQIVLLSAIDGSTRQLKSLGWVWPSIGGISPDGRFLVYSLSDESGERSRVFVLATDGSREAALVDDAFENAAPLWTPDGHRVVFISDRNGTHGLWSIGIADGKPVGGPELVRRLAQTNIAAFAITADGSFFYGIQNRRVGAYVADFDPIALTTSRTEPVTEPVDGTSMPQFSPDGQSVAFLRRPGSSPAPGDRGRAGAGLVVRSLVNGTERVFSNVVDVPIGGRLLWHPDSRSLFALLYDPSSKLPRVVNVNVQTGEVRSEFRPTGPMWPTMAMSPDGAELFYSAAEIMNGRSGPGDLKRLRLVKRVLGTGQETDLHTTQSHGFGYFGLTVSSDGRSLAFSLNVGDSERSLMVMPAGGGTPVEIRRWSDRGSLSFQGAMSWTPDGRYLIVTGRCGTDRSDQLCAISRDGKTVKPIGTNVQSVVGPMLSADGRRLAFTGSMSDPELWVIRGAIAKPSSSTR